MLLCIVCVLLFVACCFVRVGVCSVCSVCCLVFGVRRCLLLVCGVCCYIVLFVVFFVVRYLWFAVYCLICFCYSMFGGCCLF